MSTSPVGSNIYFSIRQLRSFAPTSDSAGREDEQLQLLVGNPNTATQFCIIGDALVVVERDQPETQAAAKLAFYYRVNLLSRLLNERGLIHRGVLTSGPVKCFKFEGSSLITGQGILKAACLEKNLKIAGMFFDESVVNFMELRSTQMNQKSIYVPFSTVPSFDSNRHAPGLVGTCFSQYEGWEFWNQIIRDGLQSNDKVINASALIGQIRIAHKLP